MDWLFAALAGVGFVEILLRLPLWRRLTEFRATIDKVRRVIRSARISDHWKERVLPRYAVRMLGQSTVVAVCLLAAFVPALLLALVSRAMGTAFVEFAAGWVGLSFMTVLSTIYAAVRIRLGRT